MSRKERDRLAVFKKVEQGETSLREASEMLNLSYRQARRIRRRFAQQGAAGLLHRSRGRPSNRAAPRDLKQRVLELFRAHYADYGPTLAAEVLADEHGLSVHPEALRRWLHEKHLLLPRTRLRTHRRRRARRKRFGQLLQIDGSDHRWFGQRGRRACLMVEVDDATGRVAAHLSEQETVRAAYSVLRKWIIGHGVPEAVYVDRKTVYAGGTNHFQRGGTDPERPAGDFLRCCDELGVRVIFAHSPQAKGRVERMNQLLQDRLVKELRRRGISTIDEANAMLDQFTDRLNEKFAINAGSPIDAHRRRPALAELNRCLSREETRSVQQDWTISWRGRVLQILTGEHQPSPRQRISVRECYDGTLELVHQGRRLLWKEVTGGIHTNRSVRPPRGVGGLRKAGRP